jgi:hypothetical protein
MGEIRINGARRKAAVGQAAEAMSPPPNIMGSFLQRPDGIVLSLGGVGALVALGHMARHEREGKDPLGTVESIVTGMMLYGLLELARSAGPPGTQSRRLA